MQNCDHSERSVVGRVGDHIIADNLKSQTSRREIRTSVSLVWEAHQRIDRLVDFFHYPISSIKAVSSDVFPDFIQIGVCLRVEDKLTHGRRRSSLLRRSALKAASPSTAPTLPLFNSS